MQSVTNHKETSSGMNRFVNKPRRMILRAVNHLFERMNQVFRQLLLCNYKQQFNFLVYSECFDPWFLSGSVYRVFSMTWFGNSTRIRQKFGSLSNVAVFMC